MADDPGSQRAGWRDVKDLIATGVTAGSRSVAKSQRGLIRRIADEVGRVTGRADALAALGDAVWLPFALSHAQVRLVTQLTSRALDVADELVPTGASTAQAVPLRSDVTQTRAWAWDGFLGLVNGLVGDHLARVANPLALAMTLRVGDTLCDGAEAAAWLAARDVAPRHVVVFVHGLTATEWSWAWDAEAVHGTPDATYATLLLDEPAEVAVYVRYNTGRHISDNGQRLSQLLGVALAPLLANGDVEISLVGHSMGGLVARSAAHYGDRDRAAWVSALRRIVTLGTPHQGAPLEQLGHVAARVLGAIGLPGTQVPADIIDARSAGIQDLRRGAVVEEDWQGRGDARGPSAARWLPGVAYHRVAGTVAADPASAAGRVVGDTMVQPRSALALDANRHGERPQGEVVTLGGVPHVALANHPAVLPHLRRWLKRPASATP